MPRRPRPAHRAAPKRENAKVISLTTRTTISKKPDNEEFGGGQDSNDGEEFGREDDYSDESGDESVDEDDDADVPRVVQWVDEDELEERTEETEDEDEEEEEKKDDEETEGAGSSQLKKLQKDFSNLPFGALRKAQSVLGHAEAVTDSEDEDESDAGSDDEGPEDHSSKEKERVEWSTKPRTDIAKRANKHAPTEVTSKRPVGRLRQVVEVKKQESRDPRFLAVTGEFREEKFQQNYGFLTDAHKNELKTLRESLKRARKLLANAPRHLRDEYEQEVERLEQAVKRAESIVNKDRMESIRMEALHKASKEEKEKRKLGKGSWYLKESEKRELITRAKYETLAAEGGQRAVKKAIEKRQKKIGQKEKKSRPFPKSAPSGDESRKRRAGDESNVRKRRRVG